MYTIVYIDSPFHFLIAIKVLFDILGINGSHGFRGRAWCRTSKTSRNATPQCTSGQIHGPGSPWRKPGWWFAWFACFFKDKGWLRISITSFLSKILEICLGELSIVRWDCYRSDIYGCLMIYYHFWLGALVTRARFTSIVIVALTRPIFKSYPPSTSCDGCVDWDDPSSIQKNTA